MAARTAPLSAQEFHRRYDGAKPAYEFWFGEAVQKSMPTLLHGIVQALLVLFLEPAGWKTSTEVRLKVRPDAEPIPDLIATRGKYSGAYPTAAPELCVEILSPSDQLKSAFGKAQHYLEWGAKSVWIIDPEKRTAWTISELGTAEPLWVAPGGVLRIRQTEISLDDLFAEVDRRLEPGEVTDSPS